LDKRQGEDKKMMDWMEKKFDNQINQLGEKEAKFFRGFKKWMFQIYNGVLKPVLWAIFLFWMFNRIKGLVGIQEAFYIQGIVIILFLRIIASRLV